jgi:Arc/MetJ-type ribon-helix-helix transcriptional regulator
MNISLTPELKQLVQQKVESGQYLDVCVIKNQD